MLLFSSVPAFGVDFSVGGSVIDQGEYRQLNQQGFLNVSNTYDDFLIADVRGKVTEGGLALKVAPELRSLVSQSITFDSSDPLNPAFLTVNSPKRFLNVQQTIFTGSNSLTVADFDVLDLSYSTDSMEIYAGRRPIGIGVVKSVPIWNKFTKPLLTISGYPLVFNPDMAGLRVQSGTFAFQAFRIQGNTPADAVNMLEEADYSDTLEIHFLESYWWQTWVVGLALVKDFGGLTLRSETLYIDPSSTTDNQVQTELEGEYALNSKLSMLASFFLYSRGATTSYDYSLTTFSRFNPYHALAYGFLQLSDKQTSLLTLSGTAQVNWIDFSAYLLFRALYAATSSLDVYADLNFPIGGPSSEFSNQAFIFTDGSSIGIPSQFDVGLKYYF